MNLIYENRKNCHNLSNSKREFVSQWVSNKTTDRLISISSYPIVPQIFYTQWNQTHYEWCGPMLMIAEYFAKFTNTRIRLTPFIRTEDLEEYILINGLEAFPDIQLVQMMASDFVRYVTQTEGLFNISSVVSYTPGQGILARIKRERHQLFQQFECFESEVYYAIFISIVLISCVKSLFKKSSRSFLNIFWSYLSVILSDYHTMKWKSVFNRLIAGVWLMLSTILLAAFSGQLRDSLMKPIHLLMIDSMEDLYDWPELTIQVLHQTVLDNYLNNSVSDPRIDALKSRVVLKINDNMLYNYTDPEKFLDFDGVVDGKTAVVYNYDYIHIYKQNLISRNLTEDIDFHISVENFEPFFTILSSLNLNDTLIHRWNSVESGLYEYHHKTGMNPLYIGPDIVGTVSKDSHEFDNISIERMKEIFSLYFLFTSISIGTLYMEWIRKLVADTFDIN